MRRLLLLGLVCAVSMCLHAQVVDSTVCDILKDPSSFNGKIVRIKATVVSGFDQFVVRGPECGRHVDDIWLSYPEGTKAKGGPAALLQLQPASNFTGTVDTPQRTPVTLDKSKEFKQFDSLVAAQAKSSVMCIGCPRYEVSATLVGRLDGTVAKLTRDKAGKIVSWTGFGNLNAYSARLVLQSVSDVTSKEIDYSATASLKDDSQPAPQTATNDPIQGIRDAIKAFGAGSQAGEQVARFTDAYAKEGQKPAANGVITYNGSLDEAAAKDEAKGAKESPDGILFLAGFNPNRLSGDAIIRAYAHMGEHIADMRTPEKGYEAATIFEMEFRAWSAVHLNALAYGQKVLVLPGDILLWNAGWTGSDKNSLVTDNIKKYITTEELLSR